MDGAMVGNMLATLVGCVDGISVGATLTVSVMSCAFSGVVRRDDRSNSILDTTTTRRLVILGVESFIFLL